MTVVNGLGATVSALRLSRRRHGVHASPARWPPGGKADPEDRCSVRAAKHGARRPAAVVEIRAPRRESASRLVSRSSRSLAVLGARRVRRRRARQLPPRARVARGPAVSDAMLQLDGLVRHFDGVHAVDDVSFSVERGQVLGFIGPNGAGKTTTMRILATLDTPQRGDARIGGYSVVDDPEKVRRITGFMPDYAGVYANTTVERVPRLLRARLRPARRRAAAGGREHHRVHGHRRSAGPPRREPLEGPQAARRARPRDHPRSAACSSSTSRPPTSIRARGSSSGR